MNGEKLESLICDLLACLDEQIGLLMEKYEQMTQLSDAMVARDDDATELILERMERTQNHQKDADNRLARARSVLAELYGLPAPQLRLSRLVEMLDETCAEKVARKRERIIELAAVLQRRHLRTVMLLNEYSRINRMMLKSLMPSKTPVVTYGADGAGQWSSDSGMLDMES